MIALLQRVQHANVIVDDEIIGEISRGILIFIGVEKNDDTQNADRLCERYLSYRVFSDEQDKMDNTMSRKASSASPSSSLVKNGATRADGISEAKTMPMRNCESERSRRAGTSWIRGKKTKSRKSPSPTLPGRFMTAGILAQSMLKPESSIRIKRKAKPNGKREIAA